MYLTALEGGEASASTVGGALQLVGTSKELKVGMGGHRIGFGSRTFCLLTGGIFEKSLSTSRQSLLNGPRCLVTTYRVPELIDGEGCAN